jgi:hypothetical protein
MRTIKSILLLAAMLLGAGFSSVAQQGAKPKPRIAPDALVATLYKESEGNRSPFFQTENRALVDKYFEKTLAELIWKDAIVSKGEVGAIDGDPLFDAQDMDIKNFSVHSPKYKDAGAEVAVSFENFGNKEEVLFLLVMDESDWKIADIKYKEGRTLKGILKGDAADAAGQSNKVSP